METSTLRSIDSTLLLKRQIPHYKTKIICDNNGRVRGYLRRQEEHGYQPIALKGLSDHLTEEAIEKTAKMLESSYVKLQGNHLHIISRGLGGVPPPKDAPKNFICPISHKIMKTPIVASCGHTFEKAELRTWIYCDSFTQMFHKLSFDPYTYIDYDSCYIPCPTCRKPLNLDLNSDNWPINIPIKAQIDEWKQQRIEPVCPRALCENPVPLDTAKSNLFSQLIKYPTKQILQLAKYYVRGENDSEIIKQYEETIKITDNIETYVEYIQFLLKADYQLKASKAFVYLARWRKKNNNHQEVIKAYREALQLQPENKNFLEEFARYLEEIEEKEEAIHSYLTLIALTKKEKDSFPRLAKYYKKLIELEPNELNHYKSCHELMKKNDKKAEAKELKKKILEMQGITWSDPEKTILRKKVKKLEQQNAELEKECSQLQATEKRLAADMKRILATLNEKFKGQKKPPIHSRINQISNKTGKRAVRHAIELLRKEDPMVTELSFEREHIGIAGAQALEIPLKVNQSIQTLNLAANGIGIAGAQALGEIFMINQSVQSLDLNSNQIGDAGTQALGTALEVNQSILTLNLEWNQIGGAGAQTLGAALKVNQSVQSLDLCNNQIGNAGAEALGTALQVNQSILTLNLGGNRISATGAQALGAALQVNRTLQSLNLERNQIGTVGAQAFATALQVNQSIRTLDLRRNYIGDAGAQALAKALKNNLSLQNLLLTSNEINNPGAYALARALEKNSSIQRLDLSDQSSKSTHYTFNYGYPINHRILTRIHQLLQRNNPNPTPEQSPPPTHPNHPLRQTQPPCPQQ